MYYDHIELIDHLEEIFQPYNIMLSQPSVWSNFPSYLDFLWYLLKEL